MPGPDNLYEGGKGDARQTTRDHLQASEVLFRPRYRRLNEDEVDLHDRIKTQAAILAALFYEVEPIHAGPSLNRERGANVQLAIRNLEDAVYRAVKALTGPTEDYRRPAPDPQVIAGKMDELKRAVAAADEQRQAGINDLPKDQQEQLDQGRPIEPRPDPGSQRPDDSPPAAPPAPPPAPHPLSGDAPVRDFVLIGSDAFDAVIDIGGPVQLGQLVSDAHQRSGVTVAEWNGLSQDLRDGLIREEIELQRANVAAAAARDAQDPAAAEAGGGRPAEPDGRGSTGDAAEVTRGPQA